MEKPLVSVIIPCYNQGQYLREAVDSVLASTYTNIQIIIVNDGSTQHLDILNNFSAPKTHIIHQENQGLSMARNNGINEACGKYILPLDADDKIHPTYIEKALNIIENNDKIGIVYCDAEFFGIKTGKWKLKEYNFKDFLLGNYIFCSALYRKSDWAIVGGYKKEMVFGFEDWEFWLSLIEMGAEVYKIPETLFLYRQTNKSMSESLSKNSNKIMMFKQIMKFHPNLYINNLSKILLPMHKSLEFYASRGNFILRVRYKIGNILRKMLEIISIN